MVITQGDIFWYDFPEPTGSEPGYERPVVVVQGDALNRSRIATAVVVVLTENMRLAGMPGNVLLPKKSTRLAFDSVANVTQLATVNRTGLRDHASHLAPAKLDAVLLGIGTVIGRQLAKKA